MPQDNNQPRPGSLEELETLYPPPITVALSDGRNVPVPRLTMKRLSAIALPLQRIANDPLADDLLALIGAHGADLFATMSAATDLEVSILEELEPEDFAKLMKTVLKANSDFFVRRLPGLAAEVRGALLGDGPTASPT